MRSRLSRLFFFAVLVSVAFGCSVNAVLGVSEEEASTVLVAAESDIVVCYSAVAEADEFGANVTVLLTRLGEAGELLSLGELAFSDGDFDSALVYAGQSQGMLSGFVDEAHDLGELAFNERYWSLTTTILGSIIGVAAVVVGGVVFWFLLKRRVKEGAGK